MKRSRFIIPFAVVAVVAGGLTLSSSMARAQDIGDRHQSLITRIAQKFNLKESDVKAVFEEEHAAREAEMKAELEQKLTAAVTADKITEAQKNAILNKLNEMHEGKPDRESFGHMTEAERRAAMEQKRAEMEAWAKDNGLTIDILQDLGGFGGKGHFVMKIAK